MRKLLLLVGTAAMLGATPALADKPAKGHGAKGHVTKQVGHKASAKASSKATLARSLRDRNGNRIDDRDEALARKYGGALCPPGQAKRDFREGQRLSSNYRYYTPYGDIPMVLRDRYGLDDDNRYIYRNNVIYTVDPRTSLVTRIINAIL
jgi:hypothetical protein